MHKLMVSFRFFILKDPLENYLSEIKNTSHTTIIINEMNYEKTILRITNYCL